MNDDEELDLDNKWYEAFTDRVHQLGKNWPQQLTQEEYDDAERYADYKFRRPKGERDDSGT